jgi:hypothetical protein
VIYGRLLPASAQAAGFAALMLGSVTVLAQTNPSLRGALGTQADLPFPSVGRIVLAFLLTAGLAVGLALAARRLWPLLARRRATASGIRTLDRSVVSTSLSACVIEVEGTRFLVIEGRSGVAVTQLRPGQAQSTGVSS